MDWQLTSLPFPGRLLGLIDFIGTNIHKHIIGEISESWIPSSAKSEKEEILLSLGNIYCTKRCYGGW